jgi:hypothetical protein
MNTALRILAFALVSVLLLSTPAVSKPKPTTKTFSASCTQVWNAAKSAVKEHYDVLSLNDQEQSGSFTTGSAWTGVRPVSFSLSGTGDTCTVSVTGHFSGLIHNDKGDLFKRIDEALKVAVANATPEKGTKTTTEASTEPNTVPEKGKK